MVNVATAGQCSVVGVKVPSQDNLKGVQNPTKYYAGVLMFDDVISRFDKTLVVEGSMSLAMVTLHFHESFGTYLCVNF